LKILERSEFLEVAVGEVRIGDFQREGNGGRGEALEGMPVVKMQAGSSPGLPSGYGRR
jgi:hypothetical protein